ncbi:hypothetical protein [Curtobacterium sp. Leaf261]|uniref:hypothetical protein n=1 Tax=Curtobacterium sp. Leaf261 TaxID=1736311 RepID=UPI0007011209|nr:hypothetical protein [Curtobacterium sp. Leaf261]KQO65145.1 hypothetical protein ASF23_03220 [Curtobacterium sp. Leaf261]
MGSLVGFEAFEMILGVSLAAPELIPLVILGLAVAWFLRERIRASVRRVRIRIRAARVRRTGRAEPAEHTGRDEHAEWAGRAGHTEADRHADIVLPPGQQTR